MAPNKFEKHIKKELQEREIQPSASAWDRLSEKLDADKPQPRKRHYFWYGMAASVIGLLIVSIVYFNANGSVNTPDIQIVDTTDETTETEAPVLAGRDIEEVDVGNEAIKQLPPRDVKSIHKNQTPELKNQITSAKNRGTTIDSAVEKVRTTNDFKEEVINTMILEIVATVDSLEQNNTALTNAEVDDLLRDAQKEILRDKLFDQNGSVDAMALLTEVEDELDQSFRDQIFESLKAGFLKVRTAVADRNK